MVHSLEARETVSFGLGDILIITASDSVDFGPVSLDDALLRSGQEACPSAAYSELIDVLSRATEKLAIDWPDEPYESQSSKLDERFLSGASARTVRRKLPFFSDLHNEVSRSYKQPFSARLASVTTEAVKELLRMATDLALRATEHTVRAVHRSMAGLVAAERPLGRDEEEVFLPQSAGFSKKKKRVYSVRLSTLCLTSSEQPSQIKQVCPL